MNPHKTNKSLLSRLGFTLTELIVVIAILGILATISFIMLQGYIQTSRDSVRVSDINSVSKALTLYDAKTGSFPEPDGAISINYGTDGVVWRQGKVGESVVRNIRMNKITLDPHFDAEYTYSVTPDKKSYQIASLIETDTIALNPTIAVDRAYAGDNAFLAYIKGNYNELAAKVVDDTGTCKLFLAVPSIILADLNTANGTIDIKNPSQVGSGSLVFMKKENLPASYSGYLSDGSDLAGKFTFKDFSGSGAVLLDGCDSASLEAVGADICTTIGKTCTKDEKLAYASTALANSLKEFYGNTSIASGDSYSSFTQSADGTPLAELGSNIARNDLGISMKPLSASVL